MTDQLIYANVKTSETDYVPVLVTVQRGGNDSSGNPMYNVQVWTRYDNHLGQPTGSLWTPKVKGYRLTKDRSYRIQSYNISEDVTRFMEEFEKAVKSQS